MKKGLMAASAAIALAGCATWGQMDEGLSSLVGQPIQAAIQRLGYPSGEQRVAGMHLIVWGAQRSGAMLMPTTTTTTGNAYSPGGFSTYQNTTSSNVVMPMNGNCTITLQVDESNIIQGYQYNGNLYGCESYIKSLKR